MFAATLLCQILLATAALAIPTSRDRLSARVARRDAASFTHQSQPNQPVEAASVAEPVAEVNAVTNATDAKVVHSTNWAGAVLSEKTATYKTVTGTFVVPHPKEPSGGSGRHSSAAWVGIDGASCGHAILQTGVDFNVNGSSVSYNAWYEWFPAPAHDFTGISFKAGDHVTVAVTATSKTSGKATITNKSTGKTVSHTFTGQKALCEENAEWIVEDFSVNGSLVPFANFGKVEFTDATATTLKGKAVGPAGATLWDLVKSGKVVTKSSTGNREVTISYVG
ncbi:hypothetical protein GSI_00184 [Ganoderma sinense ZZ0214-1]|uniref:Uncharacterized protein n=1 Tax=Ganoderma sinense ZZ0214-1 TaxID=1077348 RepID=A0A2G8SRU7_9APHY|nr:hypothetical protein GSI_00184 [Ganoderma sinense ZZ0214-1]